MPFDRRFAFPSYNEFDDQLLPECDDCAVEDCTKEIMNKCPHWIKVLEDIKEQNEMEYLAYEQALEEEKRYKDNPL